MKGEMGGLVVLPMVLRLKTGKGFSNLTEREGTGQKNQGTSKGNREALAHFSFSLFTMRGVVVWWWWWWASGQVAKQGTK